MKVTIYTLITLTEGTISYKLRFPFNEFVNINTPKGNKALPHEPMKTLDTQGIQGIDNEKVQIGYKNFCEPQFVEKKQGVTLKMQLLLSLAARHVQFSNS